MPARRLRRVLFRSLAALVTLAVVLAALKITKWPLGFMAEKGWLPDEPPCVVCGDLPQAADELGFIAHAAGEIEGRIYTNSLEAIEQAIAAGYRFIEVDLRKTLDNSYYGAPSTPRPTTTSGAWCRPRPRKSIRGRWTGASRPCF